MNLLWPLFVSSEKSSLLILVPCQWVSTTEKFEGSVSPKSLILYSVLFDLGQSVFVVDIYQCMYCIVGEGKWTFLFLFILIQKNPAKWACTVDTCIFRTPPESADCRRTPCPWLSCHSGLPRPSCPSCPKKQKQFKTVTKTVWGIILPLI